MHEGPEALARYYVTSHLISSRNAVGKQYSYLPRTWFSPPSTRKAGDNGHRKRIKNALQSGDFKKILEQKNYCVKFDGQIQVGTMDLLVDMFSKLSSKLVFC